MRTYLDCIPCFVRQTLDAVAMVTRDEAVHERVLRDVLQHLGRMDLHQPPPVMAQQIHRLIRNKMDNPDPYRDAKDRFNRLALRLLPGLSDLVAKSPNQMETAVRLIIAGNVIDSGVNGSLDERRVHEAIEHALVSPLDGDVNAISQAVLRARRIVYLTDNAGEIVFDRLLVELLPREKVTVCVRGYPILNDATITDAEMAGLTKLAEVIDNGSDAPGTILDDCSDEFRRRFDQADVVIAKGQGNFETLSDVTKDVFFVFKAKCPVVAREVGCPVDSLVVRRSRWAVQERRQTCQDMMEEDREAKVQ